MHTISLAIRNAHLAARGLTTLEQDTEATRKAAGAKAAATKGETGHRRAWLKAKITMATRERDRLAGAAKGQATKAINALKRELATLDMAH